MSPKCITVPLSSSIANYTKEKKVQSTIKKGLTQKL
nr:MAG TPA: hypothetical protein [Caudoviricetes sp.]